MSQQTETRELTPAAKPWQPIDSAPRDGRPLLLFARSLRATASIVLVGWWSYGRGWRECAFEPNHPVGVEPSHWMPLPGFPGSPACSMCSDRGEIGGFVSAESGYQTDPCPDCAAPPAPVGGAGLTDAQIAEQPARYSIDGAIAFGRMGTNEPPSGHWLTEYWHIGRQLAKLGETSAWDNQTPVSAPLSEPAAWLSPGVAGACFYVTDRALAEHYGYTRAVYDAAPAQSASPAATLPDPSCSVFDDMLQTLEYTEAVYRLNVVKDDGPSSTLANLQRVIARAKSAPQPSAKALTDGQCRWIFDNWLIEQRKNRFLVPVEEQQAFCTGFARARALLAAEQPSEQATTCACCGHHKPTPLRVDWLGGYVCLNCIDTRLQNMRRPSEDKRDAERYRWLRSDDIEVLPGQHEILVIKHALPFTDETDKVLTESDLDEAIDAAIAKGEGHD